jgi:hypothetical protein
MDLAICFEDLVDQHRKAGSRKPIADAERELFEFEFSKEKQRQPGLFQRWQKNIKKKRLRGQREWQRRRAAAQLREAGLFQRLKKRLGELRELERRRAVARQREAGLFQRRQKNIKKNGFGPA